MTQPETLPLACKHCGNGMPLVNAVGVEKWVECDICGMRGPKSSFREYAIKDWNALCSPDKPETQAVAWMKIIKTYDHNHGVEDVEAEFDFTPDCPGEGWRPLFASPVTEGGGEKK